MKNQNYANEFAKRAHASQKYGKHPYIKHLDDVVKVLIRFRVSDENILIAGKLHDTIEDTCVTFDDLKREFGEIVADTVLRVTNEPGENREERLKKTYPKIKGNIYATTVKLADRIANAEESIKTKGRLWKMYKSEFNSFKEGIQVKGLSTTIDQMWEHLESIFFSD